MKPVRPFPAPGPGSSTDPAGQALPGVTEGLLCQGCGQRFTPTRTTQRHCRPAGRVAALRRRRFAANGP
jgi:hypothetical protein